LKHIARFQVFERFRRGKGMKRRSCLAFSEQLCFTTFLQQKGLGSWGFEIRPKGISMSFLIFFPNRFAAVPNARDVDFGGMFTHAHSTRPILAMLLSIATEMIHPKLKNSEIVPTNSSIIASDTTDKEKFLHLAKTASAMSDASNGSKGVVPATTGIKNTHSGSEAPWYGSIVSLPCITDERRSRLAAVSQQLRFLLEELWESTDVVFSSRGTFLLALGPVVIVGNSFGMLSEASCFALAGIALIPCAER
jgi:hypothetical protein